jgi:hypothetical protein
MQPRRRWTAADDASLLLLAKRGDTVQEISRALGRTPVSVDAHARRRGIALKGPVLRSQRPTRIDSPFARLF